MKINEKKGKQNLNESKLTKEIEMRYMICDHYKTKSGI